MANSLNFFVFINIWSPSLTALLSLLVPMWCEGVSLVEGIEAATKHPARVMGLSHSKGSLDYGADADFLLLRDQGGSIAILHTFIAGECVYSASNAPHLEFVQHQRHADKK